jgi:hypothetical protein
VRAIGYGLLAVLFLACAVAVALARSDVPTVVVTGGEPIAGVACDDAVVGEASELPIAGVVCREETHRAFVLSWLLLSLPGTKTLVPLPGSPIHRMSTWVGRLAGSLAELNYWRLQRPSTFTPACIAGQGAGSQGERIRKRPDIPRKWFTCLDRQTADD